MTAMANALPMKLLLRSTAKRLTPCSIDSGDPFNKFRRRYWRRSRRRPAYELARKHQPVDLAPFPVEVYALDNLHAEG